MKDNRTTSGRSHFTVSRQDSVQSGTNTSKFPPEFFQPIPVAYKVNECLCFVLICRVAAFVNIKCSDREHEYLIKEEYSSARRSWVLDVTEIPCWPSFGSGRMRSQYPDNPQKRALTGFLPLRSRTNRNLSIVMLTRIGLLQVWLGPVALLFKSCFWPMELRDIAEPESKGKLQDKISRSREQAKSC